MFKTLFALVRNNQPFRTLPISIRLSADGGRDWLHTIVLPVGSEIRLPSAGRGCRQAWACRAIRMNAGFQGPTALPLLLHEQSRQHRWSG